MGLKDRFFSLKPCKLQTSMLSMAGRDELAAMREVCPGQFCLHLLPAALVLADYQSAHQLGGNGWTPLGTVDTESGIVTGIVTTVTITVTSYVDVDKVILRSYEGVERDHLEVQYEHKIVDTEEEE